MFRTLGAKVVEDSPDLQGLDPRKILNAHWQSNVAVLLKSFSPEKQALMDPGLLKAAESRIRDANVAEESANMTRYNILTQSGIASLAQANSQSSAVLSLLK